MNRSFFAQVSFALMLVSLAFCTSSPANEIVETRRVRVAGEIDAASIYQQAINQAKYAAEIACVRAGFDNSVGDPYNGDEGVLIEAGFITGKTPQEVQELSQGLRRYAIGEASVKCIHRSDLPSPQPLRCEILTRLTDKEYALFIGENERTFTTYDQALKQLDEYVREGRCVSDLSRGGNNPQISDNVSKGSLDRDSFAAEVQAELARAALAR